MSQQVNSQDPPSYDAAISQGYSCSWNIDAIWNYFTHGLPPSQMLVHPILSHRSMRGRRSAMVTQIRDNLHNLGLQAQCHPWICLRYIIMFTQWLNGTSRRFCLRIILRWYVFSRVHMFHKRDMGCLVSRFLDFSLPLFLTTPSPCLGMLAAVFWFPLGIGLCLLDRRTRCARCGLMIDNGLFWRPISVVYLERFHICTRTLGFLSHKQFYETYLLM